MHMLKQNIKGEEIYKGLERGRERETEKKGRRGAWRKMCTC